MTLSDVDRMMSVRGTIYRDVIHDSQISRLWSSTRTAECSIRELAEDERVEVMLRAMRRIRWRLTSVPLPSNHPRIDLAGELARYAESVRVVKNLVAIDTERELSRVGEVLAELNTHPTSSLFERVQVNLRECGDDNAIVVVQDRAFVSSCGEALASAHASFGAVLRPEDLRAVRSGATQIVVGVSAQLPDWLFTAPSADVVTLVHFDVGRDRAVIRGYLNDALAVKVRGEMPTASDLPDFMPGEINRPERDWRALRGSLAGGGPAGEELVPARAFAVAGNQAILLTCEGDETCRVVRVQGERAVLRRVLVRDVTEGDYLVVRTDGGRRDVISEIADEILGARAGYLRRLQLTWTTGLREYIQHHGRDRSRAELVRLGCKAHSMDEWARGSAIRPQSDSDFRAVLQLCGIEGRAVEPYFEGMMAIRSAHIRAGHSVSKALEGRIAEVDVCALAATGWMELRLEANDVRPMGLFRIEEAEIATELTPTSDVGILAAFEVT